MQPHTHRNLREALATLAASRATCMMTVAVIIIVTLISTPIAAQGYSFSKEPNTFTYLSAARTVLWDGSINPADDQGIDIPIGFNFDFLGIVYSTVRVSTNGFLSFGDEPAAAFANTFLPDAAQPNSILCPWWDDLRVADIGSTDEISYELTGVPGLRMLTVQWSSVSRITDSPTDYSFLNFQVRLRQTSNTIDFDYGSYGQVGVVSDCTATIGIEQSSGAKATVPVLGSPTLGAANWPGPNTRIRYRRPALDGMVGTLTSGTFSFLGATRSTLFLGTDPGAPYDDQSVDIPIGFPFKFYDVPQTTLRVSTNGYATFPPEGGNFYTNTVIPSSASPNNLLAPWWDDLVIGNSGVVDEISWEYFGMVYGMRKTVVEWRSVSRVGDDVLDYNWASFQIHLFEEGNRIEFHYGTVGSMGTPLLAFSTSVGLENGDGTVGFAPFGMSDLHSTAEFPATGTRVCFEPAMNLRCGDCNGDLTVAITDALQAAQHAVSVITLTGTNFLQCNVNGVQGGAGTVDILDALDIARFNVGLLLGLACSN